jgi:hypothetical protein
MIIINRESGGSFLPQAKERVVRKERRGSYIYVLSLYKERGKTRKVGEKVYLECVF